MMNSFINKRQLFFVLIIGSIFFTKRTNAQTFVNGDLEANSFGFFLDVPGWSRVPFSDPVCNASDFFAATADAISLLFVNPAQGFIGNPQLGNSFVSGARMHVLPSGISPNQIFDEGIQQTVSGFTIGMAYTIQFYQTVVKFHRPPPDICAIDQSGSWRVYANNTLLGIALPSTSTLPFNSTSLVWDQRTINFTATATSLTFKFLPEDDDPDITSGSSITGALYMGIDNISFITPLPIELVSFTAVCTSENTIALNWSTATEINNDFFTIEKSTDLINWEIITTISGAGNSNNIQEYYFEDDNSINTLRYYRLKQTDFNGTYEYFNTIAIENCENELTDLNIYPNPITGNSLLEITSENNNTPIQVQIIDLLGKIVQQKRHFVLNKGVNKIKMNTDQLAKGIYFLTLEKEGKHHQIKFTK